MTHLHLTAPKTQGLVKARMSRLSPFSLFVLVQRAGRITTKVHFPSPVQGSETSIHR